MFIYIILCIIAGILSFILLGVLTKKADGVVYNNLDNVGRITNIVLTIAYVFISPLYLFLGLILNPAHEGFFRCYWLDN